MRHGRLVWSGLAVATALTILIGLFPTPLVNAATAATDAVTHAAGLVATLGK